MKDYKKSLKQYSSMAACILAAGSPMSGQVIYVDVDPDIAVDVEFDEGSDNEYFDVDGDGINDFEVELVYSSGCFYCGSYISAEIRGLNLNMIETELTTEYSSCSGDPTLLNVAQLHEVDDTIDINDTFEAGIQTIFWSDSEDCGFGLVGTDEFISKFIGFKLMIGGETHYGWMRVSLVGNYHLRIHDYAYAEEPDNAIVTEYFYGPEIDWEEVSDAGDETTGSDIFFKFHNSFDETSVNEYRVICVKESVAATFTLAEALTVPSDQYLSILPAGSFFYDGNLNDDSRDIDGDLITNHITYNLFILTINDLGNVLSEASPSVYLDSYLDPPGPLTISDVGDTFSSNDIKVKITPSETENLISEYRIIFLKSPSLSFSISDALLVPAENYISFTPTGSTIEYILPPEHIDANGELIETGAEYRAAIVSMNNELGNSPLLNFTPYITLDGATTLASDLVLSDIGNNANSTDLQLQFEVTDHTETVDEYRIMIVPEYMADYFDKGMAELITADKYRSFTTDANGVFTINFPEGFKDVNDFPIVEWQLYYAFILSMSSPLGQDNELSQPSNGIELSGLTSLSEINAGQIEILYNNSILNISGISSMGEINIFNIEGQQILSRELSEENSYIQIDLIPGVYFFTMEFGNNMIAKKFLVKE